MSTYQAIYKCRLCGEEIIKDDLHNATSDLFRYAMHNCKDGSYGFVDFLGFREKE